MKDIINIFPFYCKKEAKFEGFENIESEIIILRSIQMKKMKFGNILPVHYNGKEVNEEIFYWIPTSQEKSSIDEGIKLVQTGLGF